MICRSTCAETAALGLCDLRPPPFPLWMTEKIFGIIISNRTSWKTYNQLCMAGQGRPTFPGSPASTFTGSGSVWWIALVVLAVVALAILVFVWLKKKNKLNKVVCRSSCPSLDKVSGRNGSSESSREKMASDEVDGAEKADVDEKAEVPVRGDRRYSPFPKRAADKGETNGYATENSLLSRHSQPVRYTNGRCDSDYVEIDSTAERSRSSGGQLRVEPQTARLPPVESTYARRSTGDNSVPFVESSNDTNHNKQTTVGEDSKRNSDVIQNLGDDVVVVRLPYRLPPLSINSHDQNEPRRKKRNRTSKTSADDPPI